MITAVKLLQEDIRVAVMDLAPHTIVVRLSQLGVAKLNEARTKHGAEAVVVSLDVPSDEFYPPRQS